MRSGVPQGSVLGPTLFAMYVDDLDDLCPDNCTIFKFADDTKVLCEGAADRRAGQLQESINAIATWCDKWRMPFNVSKTRVMQFCDRRDNCRTEATYIINGTSIEWSELEKDLGVYIDSRLSFDEHVVRTVNKGMRLVGWVARVFRTRKASVLLPVYKAVIRPTIEYASVVWSPMKKVQIAKTERVQRSFTKILGGLKQLTYTQRLSVLNLESLCFRRNYNDLVAVRNVLIGDISARTQLFRLMNEGNAPYRGHQYKLYKPRFTTEVRKCFFCERVVNSWNSLPCEVVVAIMSKKFFKLLRDHLYSLRDTSQ